MGRIISKEDIKKISQYTGSLGGKKTKEIHGSEHFANAGRKGMIARWGTKRKKKDV